jgi:hypothetical protein
MSPKLSPREVTFTKYTSGLVAVLFAFCFIAFPSYITGGGALVSFLNAVMWWSGWPNRYL